MTDTVIKPRHVPPSIADGSKRPERIAVRSVMWGRPLEVPGRSGETSLSCIQEPDSVQNRWTCDFIPAIRHFEITFFPSDRMRQVERYYVHEHEAKGWYPKLV